MLTAQFQNNISNCIIDSKSIIGDQFKGARVPEGENYGGSRFEFTIMPGLVDQHRCNHFTL